MTANELAIYLEDITDWEENPYRQAATMLRQQAKKIEDLLEHNVKLIDDLFAERKEVIRYQNDIIKQQEFVCQQAKEIEDLRKELALQKLSDISQEIEDRDSAIYATGYWKGIEKAKEKNETLDTRSYLIGKYDGLRELTSCEIMEIADEVCQNYKKWGYFQIEFARAILKKAGEK